MSQTKYAIGVDFGTESGRAVLVDVATGREVASAVYPYLNGVIDEKLPIPGKHIQLDPDWALQEGICSMLSAPLIGKNKPLGILRAYADDRDRFTPDDEAFLSAIAAQGSIAIENALAYQTIETLDSTKAAFIRVFTHELRSPVSVIRSLLQTILSGYAAEINPQQRDILERAVRRVDFLRKLIDDLLDLANGRAPQPQIASEAPIALKSVVTTVIQRFEVFIHALTVDQ